MPPCSADNHPPHAGLKHRRRHATNARHTRRRRRVPIAFTCLLLATLPCAPARPDDANAQQPVSAANPTIPVDELELILRPLTKDQLEIEADAWLELLRAKVGEITAYQLDVKRQNREIAEARQAAADAEKAKREAAKTAEAAADEVAEATSADTNNAATEDQHHTPVPAEDRAAERAAAEQAAAEAEARVQEEQQAKAEAEAEARQKEKQVQLEKLNDLREQRVALTDRVNLVLAEWNAKGGDTEVASKYVKAVTELTPAVDVSDVSATWTTIRGWLMSKEGGLRWARNIALFILTIIAFLILSIIAGSAMRRALSFRKSGSALLRDFLIRMTRRTVFSVGLIVALSMLEVPIAPFLAVIGAAGLVIGLALQGTLSNFASGIMILLHRPFDVGDVVSAAGVAGTVESMSVMSTHIKTFDNQKMIVPNNEIWGGVITNVTGLPTRRVDMVFGISYADDIAKAERIFTEILEKHPLTLPDPAPTVRLHELADSSVNFIVRPWVRTADYWSVYWDVTRTVKERLDAEGVSIPFPQRDVHLYQPNATQ